jgi:hypothetical protein
MYEDAIMAAMVIGMPSLVIVVRMLLRHKEKMAQRDGLSQPMAAAIEARLEHLERAIDAMAVEMERIGEGQRFTTKLLAERWAVPESVPTVARQREQVNTPR